MKKAIYVLLFTLCSMQWLYSQISHGGKPATVVQHKAARFEQDRIVLSGFTNPDSATIADRLKANRHKSLTFAHKYEVQLSPDNAGTWYTLANGQRVWKLHITSPNAKSLNLIFSAFEVPEGGLVFVYNPDQSVIRGGFNHLNNKEGGVLPVMPVPGDELVVEYQEPLQSDFPALLEIGSVNHDYIGIFGGFKVGEFGDSEPCEVDVNCLGTSEITKRGIVKMIVDGAEVCTGALLNNTSRDAKNYILSAAHSFNGNRDKARRTLFIFNYQCPFCSTPDIEGTREQSVAGAAMRAFSPSGPGQNLDFSLMELSIAPPDAYRPVYLGWDVRETVPSRTYCIHHPAGDVKKISVDDHRPVISTISIGGVEYYEKGHLLVEEWDVGATEPGSSGSPMFNVQDQVVGGLSAGLADCNDPTIDYFFRLSQAWDAYPNSAEQLKIWLDPENTGEERIDAFEPTLVSSTTVLSHLNNEDSFEANVLRNEASGYQAGHNSFRMLQYAEKFQSTEYRDVLGVYFVPFLGNSNKERQVKLKIWSGTDHPLELLYEKDLVVKEWLRNQGVDNNNFGTSGGFNVKETYADKQNYVPLERRITVQGNFFIGFQLTYDPNNAVVDTFALYQTNFSEGDRENTAYFHDGLEWLPFTSYPVGAVHASLWIEAVLQNTDNPSHNWPDFSFQDYVIYPNPAPQSRINLAVSDSVSDRTEVTVYNTAGARMYSTFIPGGVKNYPLNIEHLSSGIYFVEFISEMRREVHRLSLIRQD